jgi:hypothetical protein
MEIEAKRPDDAYSVPILISAGASAAKACEANDRPAASTAPVIFNIESSVFSSFSHSI